MEREVNVSGRQLLKDLAVTWVAAIAVGLGVGGAAAALIVLINSATI